MKASEHAIARVLVLSSALLAVACVPAPDSTPAPTPAPVQKEPSPPTAPPPASIPKYSNWMDAPRTAGDWSYRSNGSGSVALYGQSQTEPKFSLRCDRSRNEVVLSRAGTAGPNASLRILTETTERSLAAQQVSGQLPQVRTSLQARDPLLDAMALTKGRFAVETSGLPTLYVPAWGEVTRVIEDCR